MSHATSYYCNNVRERAACNKMMARMLKTSRLRYDLVKLSAEPERNTFYITKDDMGGADMGDADSGQGGH